MVCAYGIRNNSPLPATEPANDMAAACSVRSPAAARLPPTATVMPPLVTRVMVPALLTGPNTVRFADRIAQAQDAAHRSARPGR